MRLSTAMAIGGVFFCLSSFAQGKLDSKATAKKIGTINFSGKVHGTGCIPGHTNDCVELPAKMFSDSPELIIPFYISSDGDSVYGSHDVRFDIGAEKTMGFQAQVKGTLSSGEMTITFFSANGDQNTAFLSPHTEFKLPIKMVSYSIPAIRLRKNVGLADNGYINSVSAELKSVTVDMTN